MKLEPTIIVANEEAMLAEGCVKAKQTAILGKQRERCLNRRRNIFKIVENRSQDSLIELWVKGRK